MIFLELLVILVLTRACGEGAVRLGQSATMGEITAGIVLAAAAAALGDRIPVLVGILDGEVFHHAATAGIFFLMLLSGIELQPREIAKHSFASFSVALGGALVPLVAGIALGYLLLPPGETRFALSLLIGVAMSITAIPASARILTDLGLLHTAVGRTVIAAALFDDVIGLVLLAVLTAVIKTGGTPDVAEVGWLVGRIGVFFAVTVVLGVHVYPRVSRHLGTLQATALELSALMAVAFAYALLAEVLGVHWILGVFMAALFFEPDRVGLRAYDGIRLVIGGITAGLFAPVFFASIGARIDFGALVGEPLVVVTVIVLAFVTKFAGAGVPAFMSGLTPRESAAVGVGMSARGAVELVVLSIAVEAGLIGTGARGGPDTYYLYSSLVLMAVVTTLAVPLMLRWLMGRQEGPRINNKNSTL
ncbi:MAG: cation:proton antiporter [Alphaproteobacteria bacterium]